MAYLTKKDILEAQDIQFEDVEVPEWGGTLRLRSLTGSERDKLELSIVQTNGKKATINLDNLRAKTIALCAVDENNNRIFSDKDVQELGKKSGAALSRCFEVAQRLSGLSEGDVNELVGNFLATQSEGSGSG